LDVAKAYDSVEWRYLEATMLKLGFAREWVTKIMHCVSLVSFGVLVNGTRIGPIVLQRGIRQGDPLSPYLFRISAEGFSKMFTQAASIGDICGVKVCKGPPSVRHLLFADEFILCRIG